MRIVHISVGFLALFAMCSGYRCPNVAGRTYHATVETECQTYHLCENSQMETLSCPSGQAFDHQTNECKNKSLVHCTETASNHLQKRSIEEVHSVSVELLKTSTKELLNAMKYLSKNAFQEILPSVYDRIEKDFVPVIASFKDELEPVFYQALPFLEKFYTYTKRMEEKVFKKIYRSYELSNSTHLNLVSFDDVMEQIFKDLKPIMNLAKFYSMKIMKNNRAKREVEVFITEQHQYIAGVHSISKAHLKNSLEELVKTVKVLAEKNLQEIFPSIYHRFQNDYCPFIQFLKNDLNVNFTKQALPSLLKFKTYAKHMGDKIVQKVYQSYELSNSTHLNVVVFDDIFDDIFTDIKPFLNLGKFVSARLLNSLRVRRDVTEDQSKRIVEVHSIPIEHIKESTTELLKEIKSLLKDALKNILPTSYDTTVFKSLKNDIEPIFKKLLLPQLEQFKVYAKCFGDKIVRKVYQSYELSNSTHLNIVPFDDIMDEILRNSKQFLTVGRYFSSRMTKNFRLKREAGSFEMEHRHQRSVEEIHSFPIQTLKNTSIELLKAIKAVSKKTLQEILPSVYDHIYSNYIPIAESFKNDLEPILKKQALPSLQMLHAYAKRMGDKIFRKIYRTYELSNSTHLNVVSFDDVMDEIYYDTKTFLERYFSIGMVKNSRGKRDADVPVSHVPELIFGQMEPALKSMFASFTGMFSQDQNTLTSRVIIPTLIEMMNDPETKDDVSRIFWSSKAAFSPLMFDIMNRQSYYNPDGSIIRIPRHQIDEAKAFFYRETKPIISKIAEKHLPHFLQRCSENTHLIFATIDRVKSLSSRGSGRNLRDDMIRFYQKHFAVFKTSTTEHISSYTLSEIKQDLKPIEVGILQVALDYVDQLENSWLKIFFGRDSILFRAIFGERETYAVPSGSFHTSARSSTNRKRASYTLPRQLF